MNETRRSADAFVKNPGSLAQGAATPAPNRKRAWNRPSVRMMGIGRTASGMTPFPNPPQPESGSTQYMTTS